MAQLKDLIVTGNSNLLNSVITEDLQVTKISAPTTSGGTTYSYGTTNYVLTSNGTQVYWKSPSEGVISNVAHTWANGTTAGPTLSVTVNGISSTASAVPSATNNASGIVTTGTQTFAGEKTFTGTVNIGVLTISQGTEAETLSTNGTLYLNSSTGHSIIFQQNGVNKAQFSTSDSFAFHPHSNKLLDLGTSTVFWNNGYINKIILGENPTNNMEATTKQYVDNCRVEVIRLI